MLIICGVRQVWRAGPLASASLPAGTVSARRSDILIAKLSDVVETVNRVGPGIHDGVGPGQNGFLPWVFGLPQRPYPVHLAVVHPENRIAGRYGHASHRIAEGHMSFVVR